MSVAIRVSDDLVDQAKKHSKIEHRSVPNQIEYWAMIGKQSIENPDLTHNLVKDIVVGIAEIENGEKSEYEFG